jgi:predicted RNA-binding Zn-ribbon protein involved in translation (DUF1610 family)
MSCGAEVLIMRRSTFEASEITIVRCSNCGRKLWWSDDDGWCCPECGAERKEKK